MRQIFTKAQLVVLWISALSISTIFYTYDIEKLEFTVGRRPWTVISLRILPIIIITTVLIITLLPKKEH